MLKEARNTNATAWMLAYLEISSTKLISSLSLNSTSQKVLGHGQNVDRFFVTMQYKCPLIQFLIQF
jgi:hypothetical protein